MVSDAKSDGGRSREVRPESKKMLLCQRVEAQTRKHMGPCYSQDSQQSRHQKKDARKCEQSGLLEFSVGSRPRKVPIIQRFDYRVGECKSDQRYKNRDLEGPPRHGQVVILQRELGGTQVGRRAPYCSNTATVAKLKASRLLLP